MAPLSEVEKKCKITPSYCLVFGPDIRLQTLAGQIMLDPFQSRQIWFRAEVFFGTVCHFVPPSFPIVECNHDQLEHEMLHLLHFHRKLFLASKNDDAKRLY